MQQSNVPVDPKKVRTLFKTEQNIVCKEKEKKYHFVREVTIHIRCNTYLMVMVALAIFCNCMQNAEVFSPAHQVFRQQGTT